MKTFKGFFLLCFIFCCTSGVGYGELGPGVKKRLVVQKLFELVNPESFARKGVKGKEQVNYWNEIGKEVEDEQHSVGKVELLLNKYKELLSSREEFKVDEIIDQRDTLLHRAASAGGLMVVIFLISKQNAHVNAIGDSGYTPLHKTIFGLSEADDEKKEDYIDIIEFLLENRANPEIKDSKLKQDAFAFAKEHLSNGEDDKNYRENVVSLLKKHTEVEKKRKKQIIRERLEKASPEKVSTILERLTRWFDNWRSTGE
ncbi:ankyrin repeat domain-containing protein [Candidatus Dependentiae bacterium]|nr:ankyrin repeat domain-containing protein [Candidatus Dependentiae bacterium]